MAKERRKAEHAAVLQGQAEQQRAAVKAELTTAKGGKKKAGGKNKPAKKAAALADLPPAMAAFDAHLLQEALVQAQVQFPEHQEEWLKWGAPYTLCPATLYPAHPLPRTPSATHTLCHAHPLPRTPSAPHTLCHAHPLPAPTAFRHTPPPPPRQSVPRSPLISQSYSLPWVCAFATPHLTPASVCIVLCHIQTQLDSVNSGSSNLNPG